MNNYLSNSCMINFVLKIGQWFQASNTNQFFNLISGYYKQSNTYQRVYRFSHKNPAFKNSFSYVVMKKFFGFFEFIFDKINYEESFVHRFLMATTKEVKWNGANMISLFMTAFSLGYFISSVTKEINFQKILISIILLCLAFIIHKFNRAWGNFYKDSFFRRVMMYFFN